MDKKNLTQFARAMAELGVVMIPGYSPEARGRSERMFGTLQGRLPAELEQRGIGEMEREGEGEKEAQAVLACSCCLSSLGAERISCLAGGKGEVCLEVGESG